MCHYHHCFSQFLHYHSGFTLTSLPKHVDCLKICLKTCWVYKGVCVKKLVNYKFVKKGSLLIADKIKLLLKEDKMYQIYSENSSAYWCILFHFILFLYSFSLCKQTDIVNYLFVASRFFMKRKHTQKLDVSFFLDKF